jgi:hypothetical protein
MNVDFVLAWIIVLLAGSAITALACGLPRDRLALIESIGLGLIIGMLVVAASVGSVRPAATAEAFGLLRWPLAASACGLWLLVGWRERRADRGAPLPQARMTAAAQAVWWLLLVLVCLHVWPLLVEESLRPVFPWDAWASWVAKPKAWFLGGQFDRFTDLSAWLADEASGLRTLPAWSYPELSGWLQVWFASALGEWNEPLLLLPWVVLFSGVLAAFYVQCRRLAVTPLAAMAATYALASMPLVNAHVALAGYLDLWVAGVLALALGLWLRWRSTRSPRLLALAILLAASLPLLKREGLVWLAGLLTVAILGAVAPRRRRWLLGGAAALVVAVAFAAGAGWIGFGGDWFGTDSSSTAGFDLAWRPGGLEPLVALFTQGNWHLLGLVLVGATTWRWRELRADPEVRLVALFLLGGLAFLVGLFCFTPAAQWAERDTAGNRLVMQLVPCCLLYLALLWRQDAGDAPVSAATRAAGSQPVAT